MRRVLAIGVLAALTGCAQRPYVDASSAPLRTDIPTQDLTCPKEPSGQGVSTDQQAAKVISDMAMAGRICRARLAEAAADIRGQR